VGTKLTKAELVLLLNKYHIDNDGTVDDLRRRLREFIRENPATIAPLGTESLGTMMPRDYDDLAVKPGPATDLCPTFEQTIPSASPPPPSVGIIEPARVLDQIRKWGCHFDGRDPAMFLERVDELKHGYSMTDGLPELLRGTPLLWARNRRHAWATWADFCAEFRAQYFPWQYAKQMRREAEQRKQRPHEKYAIYATELQTLTRRAGEFSEDRIRELVIDNMNPSYRIYIQPGPHISLREIADKAAEYEGLKALEKEYQRAYSTTPILAAAEYNRYECCWRCKQRGHTRANCQRLPRKFCSQCGKDGILTRDCHPASGNDDRTEHPAVAARST